MSREDGVIRYMEKQYGKTFTCEGEVHGMFGSKSITVRLNCQDHPEMPVLASYLEKDGAVYYGDNFPAVYFHKEACGQLQQAVDAVFANVRLYFKVPDVVLPVEDPKRYTLRDYMADPLAFKSVRILAKEALDENSFQALMETFGRAGIAVKGIAAVPADWNAVSALTEKTVDDFLANADNVQTQVIFKYEKGTIVTERWRKS